MSALLQEAWARARLGYPNRRTLPAQLRAAWRARRSAQQVGDELGAVQLGAAVKRYARLLRAVRQAPKRGGTIEMVGIRTLFSVGAFAQWANMGWPGAWHVTAGADGGIRVAREAVRSFPGSLYGVELLCPEADRLASALPNDRALAGPVGAQDVLRRLEET